MSDETHQPALFELNDAARVRLAHVGRGAIAVSMIDNVFRDPERVAALGFAQPYAPDRSNLYPGLRAPVPQDFSGAFRAWLTRILRRNGMLKDSHAIHSDASFFSVVTTASADLLPIQRIPHYDSTDPGLFAAVIYLCDERFSGTSFYRHRKTGYEVITAANRENFRLALDQEMRIHGAPPREYINGDGLLFEAIFSNELRFNSAIVYPCGILHAANIPGQFSPPKDASEWRLTVTSLLQFA
jgi:hypothetical protein